MMPWLRVWNEMPTDPKWRSIARKSEQPISAVVVTFLLMLTNASANSKDRGTLENWTDEDAAAAFDLEAEAVAAIREAMQGKVLDGDRLTGWKKRQPLKEDNSRNRVRSHRERTASNAPKRHVTPCNAPDSDADTDADAENDSATNEWLILADQWKVPPIEELPIHIRERVQQWPTGHYFREAQEFKMGGARRTSEQWDEIWNDHIVARHRYVMKGASAPTSKPTG